MKTEAEKLVIAKNALRVDGDDNDEIILSLVRAVPDFIELQTGMAKEYQDDEPMCETVFGFIVTLWYHGDNADVAKLQRVIDSLLKAITIKARTYDTTSGAE